MIEQETADHLNRLDKEDKKSMSKYLCKILLKEISIDGANKDKVADLGLLFMCLLAMKDAILKFIPPKKLFDHKHYGTDGMQAMIQTIVLISKLEDIVDEKTGSKKKSKKGKTRTGIKVKKVDDDTLQDMREMLENEEWPEVVDDADTKELFERIGGTFNGIDITQQGEA